MNWDVLPFAATAVVMGIVHIAARRRLARWTHREWLTSFGPTVARSVQFWERSWSTAGAVIIAFGVGALIVISVTT